jgi:stage II sporulation protein D
VRQLTVTCAVVAALLTALPASSQAPRAATPGEAVFVLTGRGYGHGVGMSQYGAFGMAKEGRTYEEILSHYYTGTTLGKAPRREVRVLLAEGRRAVTIASESPFSALDGSGMVTKLPAGALALRTPLELPGAGGTSLRAVGSLLLRPGASGVLAVDGRPYRGRIELSAQGTFLRVVNVVPLEAYLQGVVAGEMPHTWPLEALKAQAVAARSYALASLVEGKPFDLYADVRSQVYLGVAGEKPETTQAVRATAGQVVLFEGKVATTMYFSTSGGRTASAADVYGRAVPYLVARPDPWDKASPYHRWGPVVLGARELQAKLGLSERVLDVRGVPTPSGRLRSLVVETSAGVTTVPSALLRSSLGLRSTWVAIGVLRLDRPAAPVTYGTTVRLSGLARGVDAPVVQASTNGSSWSQVGQPAVDASGSASLAVKPLRTTRYRLQSSAASSPALLLPVAPRVELRQSEDATTLEGTVRPRLAGAVVALERRSGTQWIPLAETSVGATGEFAFAIGLARGAFRARIAPGQGYAEAVTPVLTVGP